jgi:hypothetical protein
VLSREREAEVGFDEPAVRAETGIGAEQAVATHGSD